MSGCNNAGTLICGVCVVIYLIQTITQPVRGAVRGSIKHRAFERMFAFPGGSGLLCPHNERPPHHRPPPDVRGVSPHRVSLPTRRNSLQQAHQMNANIAMHFIHKGGSLHHSWSHHFFHVPPLTRAASSLGGFFSPFSSFVWQPAWESFSCQHPATPSSSGLSAWRYDRPAWGRSSRPLRRYQRSLWAVRRTCLSPSAVFQVGGETFFFW